MVCIEQAAILILSVIFMQLTGIFQLGVMADMLTSILVMNTFYLCHMTAVASQITSIFAVYDYVGDQKLTKRSSATELSSWLPAYLTH